jgi:hypothetical protein
VAVVIHCCPWTWLVHSFWRIDGCDANNDDGKMATPVHDTMSAARIDGCERRTTAVEADGINRELTGQRCGSEEGYSRADDASNCRSRTGFVIMLGGQSDTVVRLVVRPLAQICPHARLCPRTTPTRHETTRRRPRRCCVMLCTYAFAVN